MCRNPVFKAKDTDFRALLVFAAWSGDRHTLEKHNTKFKQLRYYDTWNPLSLAVWAGHWDVVNVLLRGPINSCFIGDKYEIMRLAVQNQDVNIIRTLLDVGPRSYWSYKHNRTPMHRAAELGEAETIKMLTRAGESVSSLDENGMTPLHCAAAYGQVEAMRALIQAGANVSVRDGFGRRPRDVAKSHAGRSLLPRGF